MPGDTLDTRMWRVEPELVLFEVLVGNKKVVSDGFVRFRPAAAKL